MVVALLVLNRDPRIVFFSLVLVPGKITTDHVILELIGPGAWIPYPEFNIPDRVP